MAVFITRSIDWTVVAWGKESQHLRGEKAFQLSTNVDDAAQGSDGVGPENSVVAASGVLHDGASDHDNILCRIGQLLNDEVDHLSEAGILVLEQLRDAEEQCCGFIRWELLPGVEEKRNLGE